MRPSSGLLRCGIATVVLLLGCGSVFLQFALGFQERTWRTAYSVLYYRGTFCYCYYCDWLCGDAVLYGSLPGSVPAGILNGCSSIFAPILEVTGTVITITVADGRSGKGDAAYRVPVVNISVGRGLQSDPGMLSGHTARYGPYFTGKDRLKVFDSLHLRQTPVKTVFFVCDVALFEQLLFERLQLPALLVYTMLGTKLPNWALNSVENRINNPEMLLIAANTLIAVEFLLTAWTAEIKPYSPLLAISSRFPPALPPLHWPRFKWCVVCIPYFANIVSTNSNFYSYSHFSE